VAKCETTLRWPSSETVTARTATVVSDGAAKAAEYRRVETAQELAEAAGTRWRVELEEPQGKRPGQLTVEVRDDLALAVVGDSDCADGHGGL
jgi:hypothetical protein